MIYTGWSFSINLLVKLEGKFGRDTKNSKQESSKVPLPGFMGRKED